MVVVVAAYGGGYHVLPHHLAGLEGAGLRRGRDATLGPTAGGAALATLEVAGRRPRDGPRLLACPGGAAGPAAAAAAAAAAATAATAEAATAVAAAAAAGGGVLHKMAIVAAEICGVH
jgi:hypothetical protein